MTLVTSVIQPAGPSAPYSLSEPIHRERAPTATNAMLLRALFGSRESVMQSYGRLRRGGELEAKTAVWFTLTKQHKPTKPTAENRILPLLPDGSRRSRALWQPRFDSGAFSTRSRASRRLELGSREPASSRCSFERAKQPWARGVCRARDLGEAGAM